MLDIRHLPLNTGNEKLHVYRHPSGFALIAQRFNRPLSRRLDRCDRVIHDESGDSNGGNV